MPDRKIKWEDLSPDPSICPPDDWPGGPEKHPHYLGKLFFVPWSYLPGKMRKAVSSGMIKMKPFFYFHELITPSKLRDIADIMDNQGVEYIQLLKED